MKRFMRILLCLGTVLCMCCLSFASAEQAVATSDGSLLQMEDFTLALDAGMMYVAGEKQEDQVYITVYPYASAGDTATNFNFVWSGPDDGVTPESLDAAREESEQGLISGLEEYGYTVDSLKLGNARQDTVADEPCVIRDGIIAMTYGTQSVKVFQRQLFFGLKGYVVTVSAADEAIRDKVTELIGSILAWNGQASE